MSFNIKIAQQPNEKKNEAQNDFFKRIKIFTLDECYQRP